MKKHLLAIVAIIATIIITPACDNNNQPNPNPNNEEENSTTLKGTITSNVTLKTGNTYQLDGEYIVENGATLTIEPGVTIIATYDDIVDYILIKQGAKINAIGTATQPIVMTSEKKEPGAWVGIHICGKAHTNAEGGQGSSEIGGAIYGGNDDNDNSGTLSYVRVEYTGYAFDEEHESNGITFYAVGRGTTVNHCQAYKGADDGFEFFGGTVNINNMLVTSCSDDSYDWTEGWCGQANNIAAYQEPQTTLGYDCDCLIEADNNENNYQATPIAHPTLSNLILMGNGANKQGIRLRRGTEVNINGAIVAGKGLPVAVESTETENALLNGQSKLQNMKICQPLNSKEGIYTNDKFINDGNQIDTTLNYNYQQLLTAATWTANWTK